MLMLKTDYRFKAAEYELPAATLDAARSAAQKAGRELDEQSEAMSDFESRCGERMSAALGLLEVDAVARRLEDAERWRREVRALYPVAVHLNGGYGPSCRR